MQDDTKLKIIFVLIIILFAVVCIGVWEAFLEPIGSFIKNSIAIRL